MGMATQASQAPITKKLSSPLVLYTIILLTQDRFQLSYINTYSYLILSRWTAPRKEAMESNLKKTPTMVCPLNHVVLIQFYKIFYANQWYS